MAKGKNRNNKNEPKNIDVGQLKLYITLAAVLLTVLTWSYWYTIHDLFKELYRNDDYSVGLLVPPLAIFFGWRNRESLKKCVVKPFWPGIGVILLALAARFFGLIDNYESAQRYSLVLMVIGLVLTVAGWQITRKLFWILMFLFLMVPFPGQIHNRVSGPMQRFASTSSVYVLEIIGIRVSQQGNTITLNNEIQMTVVEACSGLRMLTAFLVVAGGIAFMLNKSRIRKGIVFLSSVPIAIICNVIRLVATALLYIWANSETAEKFFHDFAGLVMMPIAVFIIFGEIWLMDKLIIADEEPGDGKENNMS